MSRPDRLSFTDGAFIAALSLPAGVAALVFGIVRVVDRIRGR